MVKHKYAALDKDDQPFKVAYGYGIGDVKVSHDYSELASYIAYYFHRCYVKLVELKSNSFVNVPKSIQNKFQDILDSEFFFHEMK